MYIHTYSLHKNAQQYTNNWSRINQASILNHSKIISKSLPEALQNDRHRSRVNKTHSRKINLKILKL